MHLPFFLLLSSFCLFLLVFGPFFCPLFVSFFLFLVLFCLFLSSCISQLHTTTCPHTHPHTTCSCMMMWHMCMMLWHMCTSTQPHVHTHIHTLPVRVPWGTRRCSHFCRRALTNAHPYFSPVQESTHSYPLGRQTSQPLSSKGSTNRRLRVTSLPECPRGLVCPSPKPELKGPTNCRPTNCRLRVTSRPECPRGL